MRWMFFALFVALVVWSCEDDDESSIQIIVTDAPSRLPFVFEWWRPEPHETTTVKFIVSLDPVVSGLDSVLCRVCDELGSQIDSFVLFDDGGSLQHNGSECEYLQSGDAEAGNGMFTRVIRPWVFTPNYSGAHFTFKFSANHPDFRVRGAEHIATTWEPYAVVSAVATPPDFFTFCDDSAHFLLSIERDDTDSVEEVRIGYRGDWGNLGGSSMDCAPVSGDTIWQGSVSTQNIDWSILNVRDLYAHVRTSLGHNALSSLSYHLEFGPPSVDLSSTADTLRMPAFNQFRILLIKSETYACAEEHIVANAISQAWTIIPPVGLEAQWLDGHLHDDGSLGDAVWGDGIATGRIIVSADTFDSELELQVVVRSGIVDFLDYMNEPNNMFEIRFDTVQVVVLPPL